jgi:biopolymer transport protein ExbD
MTWKVREEGSPRVRDGLSLEQVFEGLAEGEWSPTDEVRGPDDADWTRFENHPTFADAVALEPLPSHEDDETHIDMTPLIDVAMVLLVFFILIFTYAVLEKRLEAPSAGQTGPAVITDKEVTDLMIKVTVRRENGKTVYRIEDNADPVPPERLLGELAQFVRKTKHTMLALEVEADVPHGDTVFVEDQARGAGMERVLLGLVKKPGS